MGKEGFWKRLLLKYRLTIHNESKLENLIGFYVSPLGIIVSLVVSLLLVATVLYLILVYTPVSEYLPGHIDDQTRRKVVNDALRMDSLGDEVAKQERYLSNIRAILSGEIKTDSISPNDTLQLEGNYPIETTELEAAYAKEFEEQERYNLTSQAATVKALQDLNLYRPARGLVLKGFDPKLGHFGIDIAENPNESVLSVLDGTVIMSDYTAKDGYTLVIQHRQNLTSVYRNCYRLLKEVGDKVEGGEVIASLSGKSEEEEVSLKPYLHLELWHRGEPLDPGLYIAF